MTLIDRFAGRRGVSFMKTALLCAMFLGLAAGGGCGPTDEPTRFTPAAASDPARPEPAGERTSGEKVAPPRKIEMH